MFPLVLLTVNNVYLPSSYCVHCASFSLCVSITFHHCLFITLNTYSFFSLADCRFLHDLEQRLEGDILRFDVCDIVLEHCPALRKVYLPYVTNQAYQEQTYQRLL